MSDRLNRPLRVFLCHASSDKPEVLKLYSRLINDGIDAWLDKEKLIPGQNWQIEIPKAVKNSDIVIVCLSALSVNKDGFVQKEIKFALDAADEKPEGTIFIIPARLENCNVPERISQFHWVDLFTDDGYERLLRALKIRASTLSIELESNVNFFNTSKNQEEVSPPKQHIEKRVKPEKKALPEKKLQQKVETNTKLEKITENKSPSISKKISEFENQIKKLESHKELLEKSVSNSTMIAVAIGVFVALFGISIAIAGMASFDLNDPNVIIICFIIPIIPTIIAVQILHDDSKRKDKEALKSTNIEIQDLKSKIRSTK